MCLQPDRYVFRPTSECFFCVVSIGVVPFLSVGSFQVRMLLGTWNASRIWASCLLTFLAGPTLLNRRIMSLGCWSPTLIGCNVLPCGWSVFVVHIVVCVCFPYLLGEVVRSCLWSFLILSIPLECLLLPFFLGYLPLLASLEPVPEWLVHQWYRGCWSCC